MPDESVATCGPVWSRERAEEIARSYVGTHGTDPSDMRFEARSLTELSRPPVLYGLEDADKVLARSWLVYVTDSIPFMLKSSWIVLVSKTDGSVVFSGSANDEG